MDGRAAYWLRSSQTPLSVLPVCPLLHLNDFVSAVSSDVFAVRVYSPGLVKTCAVLEEHIYTSTEADEARDQLRVTGFKLLSHDDSTLTKKSVCGSSLTTVYDSNMLMTW